MVKIYTILIIQVGLKKIEICMRQQKIEAFLKVSWNGKEILIYQWNPFPLIKSWSDFIRLRRNPLQFTAGMNDEMNRVEAI